MPRSFTSLTLSIAVTAAMLLTPATVRAQAPQPTPSVSETPGVKRANALPRFARMAAAEPIPSPTTVAAPAIPDPTPAPQPPPVPTVADARAYAARQIGAAQFVCLDALWQHESNWNPAARNPSSGAYGIPQALPAGKMAPFGADWARNPLTQVRWGLWYIAASYGSACRAWSFWQAHYPHWY